MRPEIEDLKARLIAENWVNTAGMLEAAQTKPCSTQEEYEYIKEFLAFLSDHYRETRQMLEAIQTAAKLLKEKKEAYENQSTTTDTLGDL